MLTTPQLATLKTAITAETDAGFVAVRNAGAIGMMADFYNDLAVPAFIVWKNNVAIGAVGDKFDGAELAGLTTANISRLQVIADYSPNGVNPSLADRRKFFDDVFSGAGGAVTRPRLLALWKRSACRIEKMFATGAGSDAVPATLVFEGTIRSEDIVLAQQ